MRHSLLVDSGPRLGAFAAPQPAAAAPASGMASALEMILALALVLALIFALAWLLRRLKALPARRQTVMRAVAELSLGDKERVVVLSAYGREWLLGVTAGSINVIHSCESQPTPMGSPIAADARSPDLSVAPSFSALLRRSLGLGS